MKQLYEVEAAKALMTEAQSWSVMKWLREKKRVRKTADEANAALDDLSQSLRESWPESLREAYESLGGPRDKTKAEAGGKAKLSTAIDSQALLLAKELKKADDEAYRARMNAEETFDDAEKKLSTSLAREGCRKAIQCWELKERAIRKAETVSHTKQITKQDETKSRI